MTINFVNSKMGLKNAYVAQEVEHLHGKQEVTGSSPVVGSNDKKQEEI